MDDKRIIIFDDQPVRRAWNAEEEKWYFSVVDIVGVLTESKDPRNYWKVLKNRLKAEGSEVVTKCNQLKMLSKDGKKRQTDTADVGTVFRILQSIPSPKAEPFKLWLAKVGYERLQETVDPELSISRGRKNWQVMGRSKKWIEQRMLSIETRNKLTDYWADHGVEKGEEFAKLTNVIHEEWSGLSVKEHKNLKNLKTHNLRDHMSEAELIFTALAELSTRQIAETKKSEGYNPNEAAARKGGKISGNARQQLEAQTGKRVVSKGNYLSPTESNKKLTSI